MKNNLLLEREIKINPTILSQVNANDLQTLKKWRLFPPIESIIGYSSGNILP